ncbi:MAG: pyrroline-5-carboxylate reductase [Acidimicrobiia bacterium]|nr:pyrroline-5-carboxylate reductase [Acidimicrobiia bacterium]
MTALQVIGGGRMGEALVRGLLEAGTDPATVAVVEVHETRRQELTERLPGVDVRSDVGDADAMVLAVKPDQIVSVCAGLGDAAPARVLSIAAGVTLGTLEAVLPPTTAVVRAMPNTPSLVGCGAAAVAGGQRASDDDLAWAEEILGSVGTVVRVPEHLLDAVTGLSGSGPAYLFVVAEAMVEAAVLAGLSRPVAETLTAATLEGAGRLLAESDDNAAALRAAVTSPGGTTAAGLRALEAGGVRAAVSDAVLASAARAGELGRS